MDTRLLLKDGFTPGAKCNCWSVVIFRQREIIVRLIILLNYVLTSVPIKSFVLTSSRVVGALAEGALCWLVELSSFSSVSSVRNGACSGVGEKLRQG